MKRRVGIIVLLSSCLTLGGAATQASVGVTAASHWGCVGVQAIDLGACLSNPLPERLPIPATPTAPPLPS